MQHGVYSFRKPQGGPGAPGTITNIQGVNVMNMLTRQSILPGVLLSLYFGSVVSAEAACIAPDNGGGTANIPEACVYSGEPLQIIDGLPPGSAIAFNSPRLANHTNVVRNTLATGDEVAFETELLSLSLTGSGSLAGFNRVLSVPIGYAKVFNDAHTLGVTQSFDGDVRGMQGQVVGDPDFDLLRITAGTDFGLPSPGHTTLTQVAGGWNVDSFFDITYRIDFVGKPGGALSGMSGSTTSLSRFGATDSAVPLPAAGWLLATGFAGVVGIARRRRC